MIKIELFLFQKLMRQFPRPVEKPQISKCFNSTAYVSI